jgi:medium-chain acyl-[acyl-carrier-protein] hydrolase
LAGPLRSSDRPARAAVLFSLCRRGAAVFRDAAECLPDHIEICAVHLPGRPPRMRDAPIARLADLVTAMTPAVRPALNLPFAFLGHSMGGLLAFELARTLRREGERAPLHLFVSACRAPQLPPAESPAHRLPDAAFIERLRNLGGTPEEMLDNPELMELFLPTLRADFAVSETYIHTPEPPLDCPISAFGGIDDVKVPRQDLAAWQVQTSGSFHIDMLPGAHFFLNSAPSSLYAVVAAALA